MRARAHTALMLPSRGESRKGGYKGIEATEPCQWCHRLFSPLFRHHWAALLAVVTLPAFNIIIMF